MHIGEQLPDFRNPVAVLMACHRRFERQLHVLTRAGRMLATGRGSHREIAGAVESALRFFAVAGPLHTADEEQSLIPRLRDRLKDPDCHFGWLLEHLERDHRDLEAIHSCLDEASAGLLSMLRGEVPASGMPELGAKFRSLCGDARAIYNSHIRVEDREIYPAAVAVFSPAEMLEIGAEMAARRGLRVTEPPGLFPAMALASA